MKALIIYSVFVIIGAFLSSLIGLWIERNFGTAASLLVFLSLFFANFVASWVLTILVMDGTLRGAASANDKAA